MTHSKTRTRHEIASWWLPSAPIVPLEQPLNSDQVNIMTGAGESKDAKNENDADNMHISGANTDDTVGTHVIYSLKEGENWLSFGDDDSRGNPKISIVHGMFQKAGTADAKGEKMEIDSKPEHHRAENESGNSPLRVLCIDVDNSSKCLAVKDIGACAKKCQLDFYLVRRKRIRGAKFYHRNHKTANTANEKDAATYESDEMSSSGYTSDDEKDDHESVHEECAGVNNETLDSDDHNVYESPEHLPPRQLRVLRDGDRIEIRYTPRNVTNGSLPRIAKLEYVYARKKRTHSRKSDHYGMKGAKYTAEATGKPRLLSVKSDVKSDCKKKFKTNDTSAAEAPSDDDISVKATKNDHHKAGKDWSASPDKNASQGADDEDDGMEEYSYLTGEIVIKDQDWVSAITGDETTPMQLNEHGRWEGNGNDAATASAVVVDARSASPSAHRRATSPTTKCRKEKEVSFDAKFSANKAQHGHVKGNFSDLQITEIKENKGSQNEDVFLTAPEHLEDDENKSREEESSVEQELELLSQQSSLKDNNNDDDDITDDPEQTQPISAALMAEYNMSNEADNSKLSTVDEKKEEIDNDESTTGPESPVKLPSQVEVKKVDSCPTKNEMRLSQLTARSLETKVEEEETDDEIYNASTQLFVEDLTTPAAFQPENDENVTETQFEPPQDIESAESLVGDKPVIPVDHIGIAEDRRKNPKNDESVELTTENYTKADGEKAEVSEKSVDEVNGLNPLAKPGSRMEDKALAEFTEGEADKGGGGESATELSSSHKQEQEVSMSPKLGSPKQRSTHDNSGLLDDTAIHRDRNGAMMTGSVGGANLGDLLTSIALQSTPNFPEAAMSHKSSAETTVVNDKGTKEFINNSEHSKNRKTERDTSSPDVAKHAIELQQKNTRNDNGDQTRNVGVPSEVFVETPTKKRKSSRSNKTISSSSVPSRERSKRNRRGVSMDHHENVRVMFTGVDITTTHRKVCTEFRTHSLG